MSGASVYDFRDLDLMIKLADLRNGSGLGVESTELAEAVGLDDARGMGSRLSWMQRKGMLRVDDRDGRRWDLSRGGERVVEARLRAAQVRAVEALDDEQMVGVMAHVTSRYQHGDPMLAEMLRREFLFGTQRR